MNGTRKDVVEWLFKKEKIAIPESTVNFYRRYGLLDDCVVEKERRKTVYDVEKTVERIKTILKLQKQERLYLHEIKDILKEKGLL